MHTRSPFYFLCTVQKRHPGMSTHSGSSHTEFRTMDSQRCKVRKTEVECMLALFRFALPNIFAVSFRGMFTIVARSKTLGLWKTLMLLLMGARHERMKLVLVAPCAARITLHRSWDAEQTTLLSSGQGAPVADSEVQVLSADFGWCTGALEPGRPQSIHARRMPM